MTNKCPKCGYDFELATNVDDDSIKPKNGDISFCINCGSANMFNDKGIVQINESELPEIENLFERIQLFEKHLLKLKMTLTLAQIRRFKIIKHNHRGAELFVDVQFPDITLGEENEEYVSEPVFIDKKTGKEVHD